MEYIGPIIEAFAEALLNPPNPQKFVIKACKQHVGQKGSRCDFFAENVGLVWQVRWVSNIPAHRSIKKISETYNFWESEGNLWRPSKKQDYSYFLNTPQGLFFKQLTRVKDKRYLGNAGVQPKSPTK
jgi:hypothetical protein